MYLCWNSTSETASSKIAQKMEIRKSGEIDGKTAGDMMFLSQV